MCRQIADFAQGMRMAYETRRQIVDFASGMRRTIGEAVPDELTVHCIAPYAASVPCIDSTIRYVSTAQRIAPCATPVPISNAGLRTSYAKLGTAIGAMLLPSSSGGLLYLTVHLCIAESTRLVAPYAASVPDIA
eukprot:1344375-Rhodomonas_salina.2